MIHSVQLVDYRQLADGLVAVQAQCCGSSSTNSWLTMASEVAADDTRRNDAIAFHTNRVAQLHNTTLTALAVLPTLLNQPVQVAIPAPAPATPAPTTPSDPSTSGGTQS